MTMMRSSTHLHRKMQRAVERCCSAESLMNSWQVSGPLRKPTKVFQTVAERMNNLPKVVFSRTLEKASWNNTKLVKGDLVTEIRKMKSEPGEGMAIMGSGSIVSQLALERVIDEYQIVVNPRALGDGRTMFDGIKERLSLKLTKSRIFRNGKLFLCYEPMERTDARP